MTYESNSLTKREMEIMHVLWKEEIPLLVSEIADINHCSIHSVQTIIKSLLKKKLIEIAEITYSGKVLARKFRPTVGPEKYINETMFTNLVSMKISAADLVTRLLGEESDEQALQEIDRLEKLIKERKKQIIKNKNDKV